MRLTALILTLTLTGCSTMVTPNQTVSSFTAPHLKIDRSWSKPVLIETTVQPKKRDWYDAVPWAEVTQNASPVAFGVSGMIAALTGVFPWGLILAPAIEGLTGYKATVLKAQEVSGQQEVHAERVYAPDSATVTYKDGTIDITITPEKP